MTQQPLDPDVRLWRSFVDAQAASIRARSDLFTKSRAVAKLVQRGLSHSREREAAVDAAALLKSAARRLEPQEPRADDEALWRRFVEAHTQGRQACAEFFTKTKSRIDLVRRGLSTSGETTAALEITPLLSIGERQQLLDGLLALASYFNGQARTAQNLILSLPHDWLMANLEPHAERLLNEGTYEEYRLLFELYLAADHGLAARLAHRAVAHADEDIREAGADFLERLGIKLG